LTYSLIIAIHDAFLFKGILNLQEPLAQICPYVLSEERWKEKRTEEILKEIKTLAPELSAGKNILLIMGSEHIFYDETSCPVPDISLITELQADSLLINRYQGASRSIYSILLVRSMLKESIKGVVLNRIPPEKLKKIQNEMLPSLSEKGVPMTIPVPEDPLLSFWSLTEIGEILDGEENLNQPVGRMTVGTTDLKGELLVFKRVYNKIILLKPFSQDSQINEPVARPSVVGILLTGGRNPPPQLLQAAKEVNVPLMLVKEDSIAALERLEQTPPGLSPMDEAKARRFTALLDRGGAFDRLIQSLVLPSR
jgi:BioD-like phosphotransacetylase family protein